MLLSTTYLPGGGCSLYATVLKALLNLPVPRRRANVVSGRHYGRTLLHLVSQIPSAMPQHRRAWRPSLRAQPTGPPRPGADATSGRPVARAARGNHGHSHRPAGRPVSLVTLCGTATEPEPASRPAPLRLNS